MKLINVMATALIGSTILAQSTIFGASATKTGIDAKLLGEHGTGMVSTSGGYAGAQELKARDATAVSAGSLGLFADLKEAAQSIFGRHDGRDDGVNVLVGATNPIQALTIKENCGTMGSLTTSVTSSKSFVYPEATATKTCSLLSCYDGPVSKPTKVVYVPATIELPGTTGTPTKEVPSSTIVETKIISFTTTSTIHNGTTTSNGITPTNYGPTAPPMVSEPLIGKASNMKINMFVGGCLIALVL